MIELNNIQSSVQGVAEAISAILKVDVSIVNTKLIRIAATGKYKKYIGNELEKGCSYDYILKNKRAESITNKEFSKRCINCNKLNECEEIATIGYPILSTDNDILGVIGLIAFNKKQQIYINENLKNIDIFLRKLSLLLAGNIIYEENIKNLSLKNKEISNIINSLDYGIILTDKNREILDFNKQALNILKCSKKELKNRRIDSIFTNFPIELSSNTDIMTSCRLNHSHEEYLVKTIENKVSDETKSYIFQISKYSKAMLTAYNILNYSKNVTFEDILGESISIKNTITLAKQVSSTEVPIILKGEVGTGIDLFANAIHNNSANREKPFITINFKLISDNLIESELFGIEKNNNKNYETNSKIGIFELVNEGTLFLKEISSVPFYLQKKILEVIKEHQFTRLGGTRKLISNFKLITSTSSNLESMVQKGEFLSELYYAINVIPISIPPLRERKEDIILIANTKLKEYCQRLGKGNMILDNELQKIFINAYWRGNITELENTIEYLVNISNTKILDKNLLPESFLMLDTLNNEANQNFNFENILKESHSLSELNDDFEKNVLNFYLNKYGNNTKSKEIISQILNINISTLYRKLYRYGLN